MDRLNFGSTKKNLTIIIIVLISVTAALAVGYAVPKTTVVGGPQVTDKTIDVYLQNPDQAKDAADTAKIILSVEGMSCSGCIQTIKSALSGIKDIQNVYVDLAGSKAEVYCSNRQLGDVNRIAQAITSSGYPAKVIRVVSTADLQEQNDVAASKGRYYIAAVGDWEIARSDFDAEFESAKKQYVKAYGEKVFSTARGKSLSDSLRAQIVSRLVNEGILMQEITKANFKVTPATVAEELDIFLVKNKKSLGDFKDELEDRGYDYPYFMKKFETKVLIEKYLDEEVFLGASNRAEKQERYNSWFRNAKVLAQVVYYDKEIEQLVKQQSARQGSCCAAK
jgi:copper chaperone CopZ